MDLTQCGRSHRLAKVLVVPIGGISRSRFEQLFHLLQSGYTPLTGSMEVRLELRSEAPTQVWNDFQYHRRILGIIGVTQCTDNASDSKAAAAELDTYRAKFPSQRQMCCFAFGDKPQGRPNPAITQVDTAVSPDDLERCVGDLVQAFASHLKALLLQFAEEQAKASSSDSQPMLRAASEDPSADRRERTTVTYRRRCTARALKQLADVYVLQGELEKATTTYLNAQRQLRDLNDHLWLGGVMESYAVCLELQQLQTGDPAVGDDVPGRYKEAAQHYTRAMKEGIVPRMEAQFKLARYHIAEKQTFKAAQALSGIFMGQPPLGEADNVQLYTAVGILFQQIGMKRKAAFFLRRAALCQIQFARWGAAGSLLLKVCEAYRLRGLHDRLRGGDGTTGVDPVLTKPLALPGSPVTSPLAAETDGWPILHAVVIRDIMYTFMKLEDHVRKARVVAYFCERVTAGSAREMLPGLLMELSKSPRTTICPQSLSGVPVLSALTPCTLGDNSLPLPCVVPKRASAKDSPFIYSPFKRGSAAGKKLIWVADEVMSVRLMVCNRLPVNLSLDTIVLYGEGNIRLETCPITSLKMTPGQGWRMIELQCKPLEAGPLQLRGCLTRVYHVDSLHALPCEPIEVVSAMPRLEAISQCGELSVGTDGIVVNALLGERRSIVITLRNSGKLPVAGLRVILSASGGADETPKETILTLDSEAREMLPEQPSFAVPGASLSLDFTGVHATMPLRTGLSTSFCIEFVATSTSFHGLKVRIEYCEQSFLQVVESTPPQLYRRLQLALPVSVAASVTASQFMIERCGGSALSATSVSVADGTLPELETSVAVEDFNETHFVFAFSVKNETADAFNATVLYDNQPVREAPIQGFCSTRVRVVVEKVALGNVVQDDGRVSSEMLCASLERLVKLRWHQNQNSGEVSVRVPADALAKNSLPLVLLPRLRLRHDILVLGADRKCSPRLTVCNRHEVVQLRITVSNISETPTSPATLSILTVQTAETGSVIPTLPVAIHPIGSTAVSVPSLQTGEAFAHTVGFVCLARGRYVLSYMCDVRGGIDHDELERQGGTVNLDIFWGLSSALEVA